MNSKTYQKKFDEAKTLAGAAKAFGRWLKAFAIEQGYPTDSIHVWKTGEYGFSSPGTWEVVWEEGPYEWTIRLSLGDSIQGGYGSTPEFNLLSNRNGIHPECYNHIALAFYN